MGEVNGSWGVAGDTQACHTDSKHSVLLGHPERVALPVPLSPQLPRVPGGGLEAGAQGGVRTAGGAARRRRLGGRCGCQAIAAVQCGLTLMQLLCLTDAPGMSCVWHAKQAKICKFGK